MSQPHGLGRGLSSLIPQNQKKQDAISSGDVQSFSLPASAQKPSPFGVKMAPLQKMSTSASVAEEKDERAAVSPLVRDARSASDAFRESPDTPSSVSTGEGVALSVPVGNVVPNPHQPRIRFSEEKLMELAQSIKEYGILQPLIVTRVGNNFELIAGERRLQAAKIVGLTEVPVMIREAEDQEKFELAIIENIQRHDLNPIEESRAYERLSEEFGLSQEEIAKKMGRSRSAIANTMRLLQLPIDIQRAIADEKISEGHAKALLSIDNPEKQRALFEMIVRHGLTVREAESKSRGVSTRPPKRRTSREPELEAWENDLSEIFGTKVRIAKTATGGMIRIDYFSDEEFKNIFSKLANRGEKDTQQQ